MVYHIRQFASRCLAAQPILYQAFPLALLYTTAYYIKHFISRYYAAQSTMSGSSSVCVPPPYLTRCGRTAPVSPANPGPEAPAAAASDTSRLRAIHPDCERYIAISSPGPEIPAAAASDTSRLQSENGPVRRAVGFSDVFGRDRGSESLTDLLMMAPTSSTSGIARCEETQCRRIVRSSLASIANVHKIVSGCSKEISGRLVRYEAIQEVTARLGTRR